MSFIRKTINCRNLIGYKDSKRIKPFVMVYKVYNYNSNSLHKKLIDKIIKKGKQLSEQVNPAAANAANYSRTKNRLINNATAGILAEYCWMKYLNSQSDNKMVDYTEFTSASSQIDLVVIANQKKIEVRSSFPRNGIEFAICHPQYEFDILGPYSNCVKPGEIQKDYYVRTLFHVKQCESFINLMKEDNFKVYLTGGATWSMMTDNNISKVKNLIPEDAVTLKQDNRSNYRVVPFKKALDTLEVKDLILK